MNIKAIALFTTVLLLELTSPGVAQTRRQWGALPAVNLNAGLGRGWRLNLKWESRQLLLRSGAERVDWEYQLSDLSAIFSRKVGLNNSLAAGYLIRLREGRAVHRSIQQFTIVRRYSGWRLAQRLAADQTFEPGQPGEFRLRYRLLAELPLNGSVADPGEFYVKAGQETLVAVQAGGPPTLELRLLPLLGFAFSDKNKLEFGLDYRLGNLGRAARRESYWIQVAWFISV